MSFDYKKYSLEQLDNWMNDALSTEEATPQEIYDVIKGVVQEQYYYFKDQTSRCYELLALLNGNGKGHLSCDKDDPSEECKKSWTSFWEENYYPEEYKGSTVSSVSKDDCMPPWGHSDLEALRYTEEEMNAMCDKAASEEEKQQCQEYNLREAEYYDNKKKWVLPVELDGPSGEYFVTFPEDLQQVSGIHAGDEVQWVDNKDGSYTLRKVIK